MQRSCTSMETAENPPSSVRCNCRHADAADEAHGVGHLALERDGRRPRQVALDLLPLPRGLRLCLHRRRGRYGRGGGQRIVPVAHRPRSMPRDILVAGHKSRHRFVPHNGRRTRACCGRWTRARRGHAAAAAASSERRGRFLEERNEYCMYEEMKTNEMKTIGYRPREYY
jgi:hypothetical protein